MDVERRLLGLLRPVRRDALLGVVLAAGTLVAGIALVATATYLISRAALVTMFVEVAVLVTAVRGFAIGRAALRYAERYVTHRTTLALLASLRAATFRALIPRLPALSTTVPSGDLAARFGADIDSVDRFYLGAVVPLAAAAIAGSVAVLSLALVGPELALVLAIGLLAGGTVAPTLARHLSRASAERAVAERARLHAAITDDLAGTAELLVFGAAAGFDDRTGAAADDLRRTETRLGWLRGAADGVGSGLGGLTAVVILALAVPLVAAGLVEGTLLAVLPLAALAAFDGVVPLPAAWTQRDASRAAADRVFELTDRPAPVAEPVTAATLPVRGALAVEDVGFRYLDGGPWVLEDVAFTIPEGGRLAVMGPSGAGKSTLVDLLVRFRAPTMGRITFGGVDFATAAGDDVRSRIAVVPQRPYLFHGTLRDNLLVADGEADEGRLAEALAFAGLDTFVAGLPDGLDTLVGEDGHRLSGGERQRVAIARAWLKDAPIVVLDEATSHLDADTERALVTRLDGYLRGRTAIILAHRSGLLELADRRLELPGPTVEAADRA